MGQLRRPVHRAKSAQLALLVAAVFAFSGAVDAAGSVGTAPSASVDPSLLEAAAADPAPTLQVIVQAQEADAAAELVASIGGSVRRRLSIIDGVAADVPAAALELLAASTGVEAVSLDARVMGSAFAPADPNLRQSVVGLPALWDAGAGLTPTIAVIDSGVDATRADDFGARVVTQVNLSSREPNATGDDYGHGTMVAGLAAGASSAYPGAGTASRARTSSRRAAT